jgi:hypothetical protein
VNEQRKEYDALDIQKTLPELESFSLLGGLYFKPVTPIDPKIERQRKISNILSHRHIGFDRN